MRARFNFESSVNCTFCLRKILGRFSVSEMTSSVEIFSTVCFGLAILHTFSVTRFQHLAHRYPSGSVGENVFHLLGEVEVVFGIWAALFLIFFATNEGTAKAIEYLETRNFTEPAFVFVIMAVCATRPILESQVN